MSHLVDLNPEERATHIVQRLLGSTFMTHEEVMTVAEQMVEMIIESTAVCGCKIAGSYLDYWMEVKKELKKL